MYLSSFSDIVWNQTLKKKYSLKLTHFWGLLLKWEDWSEVVNQKKRIIHLVRSQTIRRKANISYPLIRTHTSAYQGVRNVNFLEYFLNVINEWPQYQKFMKRVCRERDLTFEQWNIFHENYKLKTVWLWLLYKITENICHSRLFPKFTQTKKEVSYLPWQNMCSNLKIPCHIKQKSFLWTKLLDKLLLAKYLISVAATVPTIVCKTEGAYEILLAIS